MPDSSAPVPELVRLLQERGWRVTVLSTPTGARFHGLEAIGELTGKTVRTEFRLPGTGQSLPPPSAVLACPWSFNSTSKTAYGLAGTFAVVLACEMIGRGVPTVIAPKSGAAPAAHAAFERSLRHRSSHREDDRTVMLEIDGVGKTYPRTEAPALSGVGLTVTPGEVVAVIGHNGAGKSTLFDIAAGLIRPTTGRVRLAVGPSRVGWCPQRTVVDWSLTVRQNISLGLELRNGLRRRATRAHIDELCDLMGLTSYIDREAESLSGGELRRTQIARAIAGKPELMILDEPTTGLDPDAIERIFAHVRERAAAGATALISTHETSRFTRYCTRVVALDQGLLIADQTTDTFLSDTGADEDLWEGYRALVDRLPRDH